MDRLTKRKTPDPLHHTYMYEVGVVGTQCKRTFCGNDIHQIVKAVTLAILERDPTIRSSDGQLRSFCALKGYETLSEFDSPWQFIREIEERHPEELI
ncbi:hypothetical protein WCWAEYFT_CDS0116 [Vibrio phage VB_VaC_TDDLMA]